jgi:hypothetical protein
MGFIEWRLRGTRDLPTLGIVQIGALFLGGLVISISLLIGAEQAGGGIYLLTQLVAVVLFVVRIWPRSLRIDWLAATPLRHIGAATLWVVAALVLFMYLVFSFISNPGDPDAFPLNVLVASDHAAYIGIITNIALGFLLALLLRAEVRRGWMGQLIFWGVNLGLIVFALGLILESDAIKRIGAPVMGIALLASLAILAYAAMREPLVNTEADLETG